MNPDDIEKVNQLQKNIETKLEEYSKSRKKSSIFIEKLFLPDNNEPINAQDFIFNGSIGTLASPPLDRDEKFNLVDSPYTVVFQTLHQINPDIGFQIAKTSKLLPEFSVLLGSVIGRYADQLQSQPFVFFGKGYAEKSMSDLIKIEQKLVNIAEYGTLFRTLNVKPFETQWNVMSYENDFVKVIEEEINKNDE